MPHSQAREICSRVTANIENVMRGQAKSIRLLMAGFASGGHVLLEDVPGTGKTTLAKALALSVDLDFSRIQFTPDLLPSDILGVSVFDQKENAFNFHKGPIFTNILLADEINRSSPRTQSALLEAMAESQVSIDGQLRRLENVFFVIATQNPVETSGTYPLPEAQMDRFSLQFSLGYVSPEVEVSIMSDQGAGHPLEQLGPCVGMEDVLTLRSQVKQVAISEELKRYIVDLVGATRREEGILMGASPRASLALMKVSQALALIDNQSFVSPDHIQEVAVSVIAHRMVMDPQARFSGQTTKAVVENILKRVPVPA
ncbi:MoxR-like ATPase [Desulfatibacillum alkenivorans DSM 16219]|jgi:MoxR-like ATPase|uniref:MoxR-like ATPase n=1 Tax=Desulfatibacillum alkenivorans DSM 16219 TaxID=1121393 RepID=A0A1M6J759_9BACT|nr:MoxR family ATPase [Desulfatibacillum alkenivorans]SHJ42457.1 MoxR-like ATPase [Desulfatibacillum alkenivorans DSM 16219]